MIGRKNKIKPEIIGKVEDHKHKWRVNWKNHKNNEWHTKFKKVLFAHKMRIEVWLCVDPLCHHIDVEVYRDSEVDDEDIVSDIETAIIKARQEIRNAKHEYYKHEQLMEALRQRWKMYKLDEGAIHTFCINCGVEN